MTHFVANLREVKTEPAVRYLVLRAARRVGRRDCKETLYDDMGRDPLSIRDFGNSLHYLFEDVLRAYGWMAQDRLLSLFAQAGVAYAAGWAEVTVDAVGAV
jgi:hypothetical protein